MSGGTMGYLYSKVEGANFDRSTPERLAFGRHLDLVAKALHDIEWVDSHDYGKGDESEAIRACIGVMPILEAAIERAEAARADLAKEIELAIKVKP